VLDESAQQVSKAFAQRYAQWSACAEADILFRVGFLLGSLRTFSGRGQHPCILSTHMADRCSVFSGAARTLGLCPFRQQESFWCSVRTATRLWLNTHGKPQRRQEATSQLLKLGTGNHPALARRSTAPGRGQTEITLDGGEMPLWRAFLRTESGVCPPRWSSSSSGPPKAPACIFVFQGIRPPRMSWPSPTARLSSALLWLPPYAKAIGLVFRMNSSPIFSMEFCTWLAFVIPHGPARNPCEGCKLD
jgi:hypothetical protein